MTPSDFARAAPTADNVGYTCPRYDRCNAGYCPALGGKHREDDSACLYLLEAVKDGGEARVLACTPTPLAEVVLADARRIMGQVGPLSVALRRASLTGSRLEAGARLAARGSGEAA